MRSRSFMHLVCAIVGSLSVMAAHAQSPDLNTQLVDAAQNGDVAAAERLLAKGANVNAGNQWGVTPLISAADRANIPLVTLLLAHRADVNAKDLRYGKTPLKVTAVSWGDDRDKTIRAGLIDLLLDHGANGGEALPDLISQGYVEGVKRILTAGNVPQPYLNRALASASGAQHAELVALLTSAGARPPGPADSPDSPERLALLAGAYRDEGGEITLTVDEEELLLERTGRPLVSLLPLDLTTLRSLTRAAVLTVAPGPGPAAEVTLTEDGRTRILTRTVPR